MSLVKKICYLCGDLLEGDINNDHTIPKHLITGQPKKRGCDYGGEMEVHKKCNSLFGNRSSNSETISPKALQLLKVMINPDKSIDIMKKDNHELIIKTIVGKHLEGFSNYDLTFFGLIDGRKENYNTLTSEKFLQQFPRIEPLEKPLNIILTVLAKSCGAFLFKRKHYYPSEKWRIYATSFWADSAVDFDLIFGEIKPFDIGVKLWIKECANNDWFCSYKLDELLVYFIFLNSSNYKNVYDLRGIIKNTQVHYFESEKLVNMINYNWSKHLLQ